MNELSNWILNIIALMFLAPILNAAHQDLHTRFVLAMSQFNARLAEPSFTTWQVVVSLIFALSVVGSYLSIRNEKYQLVMLWLVIGVAPILFTYKSASFYYMKEMESSNYKSLATQFIAKALEFDWLPLPLLKWLPLQPSLHSLTIATHILKLASTDNLDCQFESWNPEAKKVLLKNEDFATDGYLIISEQTLQHIWHEWKYVIFAPNLRARKGRMETIISLQTEMLAINCLLRKAYGIKWGPMLRNII